jgi:DNA methylase
MRYECPMLKSLRAEWSEGTVGSESTLHQLAPYIGKLKTSMAASLISHYSRPGDVVFDPFSGSGVVPLEALRLGRGAIANDFSPYAAALTRAKLFPPVDKEAAIAEAVEYISMSKAKAKRVSYRVTAPKWVTKFFHRRTFAEVKILADSLRKDSKWFLLANLLGILHHQRPGFLSHPSSHLVPYLRVRKFPRRSFPAMYHYRDVAPRLVRKIERTYRRHQPFAPDLLRIFTQQDVREYHGGARADIAVTSPPYMNALDYGRDNRLRLWFLGVDVASRLDNSVPRSPVAFGELMETTAALLKVAIKRKGFAILVVGESRRSNCKLESDSIVMAAFRTRGWELTDLLSDPVPDIRRSRRECSATSSEKIMIFRRRGFHRGN